MGELRIRALEQRILLDAAAIATVVQSVAHTDPVPAVTGSLHLIQVLS